MNEWMERKGGEEGGRGRGRKERKVGRRAHPLHFLPTKSPQSSSGRAECQVTRAVLGRGWQGTRQLQTLPPHKAHQPTVALSGGRKTLTGTAASQALLPPPCAGAQATVPTPAPGWAGENQPWKGSGEPYRRQGLLLKAGDLHPPGSEVGTELWEEACPRAGER